MFLEPLRVQMLFLMACFKMREFYLVTISPFGLIRCPQVSIPPFGSFRTVLFIRKLKKDPTANIQAATYFKSIVPALSDKILLLLGSHRNWLTPPLLDAMYTACAFEVSAFNDSTHWCSLFDEESFDQLEFWEDLASYWQKSYGIPINYQMGCLLINEIVELFDAKLNGSTQLGKLRFAHAETVLPLLAILGLYEDSPEVMSWNATQQQIQNRKFRTSDFSSFASNVVFLLSSCDSGPSVRVFSNEVPMVLPGCPSIDCPYDIFKSLFASYQICDFQKMCTIPTDS